MGPSLGLILLLALLQSAAQDIAVWTDRDDPYRRGQQAHVYIRSNQPAYITVVRADTDGRIAVIFPRDPWADNFFGGGGGAGSDFRVDDGFTVEDDPGIGYVIAIASSTPFDYDAIARGDRWDYSRIAQEPVRGDPYVALTRFARRIAPEGAYDYDIAPYHVDRRYDYPRVVCYDCHAYVGYAAWNPYESTCSRFRLEIYDHPSYYPYRYDRGRRIVVQRAPATGPRYVFRDFAGTGDYVTRLQGEPGPARGERDLGRTARDVGGRGAVPPPVGVTARDVESRDEPEPRRRLGRPGILGGQSLTGQRGRDLKPRATGEPELKRRKP